MLQRWILLLLGMELVGYIWLTQRLVSEGRTYLFVLALIAAIAFCWRLSHALASFLVATHLRRRDRRVLPLMPNLQALAGEFAARLISYNWSQVFPGLALGEEPVGRRDGTPVLLVHGYFSNRGMWIRFRQRLAKANIGPIYTVTLEPLMGSIDAMVAPLHMRVEQICRETGHERIVIVAHSMGGLVTRAYMATYGRARVSRLVTLGTPHNGTELAALGLGTCTRQMRRGSAWLNMLADMEEADESAKPPTLSICTLNDDLVYPPESADLEWAKNQPVIGVGHVGLLYSEAVARQVIRALAG